MNRRNHMGIGDFIRDLLEMMHRRRTLLISLSCVVVFITTYVLILPAFTLEKDEALKQGGIDVPKSEQIKADPDTSAEDAKAETEGETADDTADYTVLERNASEIPKAAAGSESSSESEEPAQAAETVQNENAEESAALTASDVDEPEQAEEASSDKDNEAASDAADNSAADKQADKEEAAAETADKAGDDKAKAEEPSQEDNAEIVREESRASQTEPLKYKGEGYTVTVNDPSSVLPAGTEISVEEIIEEDNETAYRAYYDDTLKAIQDDKDGDKVADLKFARFYDIKLIADGKEITPDKTVSVTIEYDKELGKDMNVDDADKLRVVHFAEDKRTGEVEPEVLDSKAVEVTTDNKDNLTDTTFEANSFSVYGVVYTVDFHWEVDGKSFEFTMPGGTAASLREILDELHVVGDDGEDDKKKAEEVTTTEEFVERISEVSFSDPKLMYIYKVEEPITTLEIKQQEGLNPEYSALMTRQEIDESDIKEFTSPDWAILGLKPFKTEETLTIEMTNGEAFSIRVTDAQSDAIHNNDGTVQTISNPAGTTIDLFDYWISDSTRNSTARAAWPDTLGTIGTGNTSGINSSTSDTTHGHALKFTPANAGSVIDGTLNNGQWNLSAADGGPGVNSWTKNANPRQGLVTGTLVNGYPKLSNNGNLGTTDESLAYLFNTDYHAGKEAFTGVNQFLYVDQDGFYKFDSNDFDAQFNKSSKTFTLRDQTAAVGDARGFWPFGTQVYWHGMHMKTQFSMPADGRVLSPTGNYNDMIFEFQGDDDTWVYVDGVLVGDGGGIHNQTFISINFREGTVTVDGKHDVKDDYRTNWSETKYLDDLYRAAGVYNNYEWVDSPTIPGHKTFAPGTYHNFDMFYLERGGGESNLHIRYNLVSTADFTAHKSFHNTSNDRLYRDEFQFELIGLDGQYKRNAVTNTLELCDADKRAIMPKGGSASGSGTVASPKKVYHEASGGNSGYTSYITGVSEDGNVNFGQADFDNAEMHDCDEQNPSTYRYIIKEIVPDDAVNADGKTWAASSDEEREEGGYVKDGITYDGKIYYMTATVIRWIDNGTPVYGLSKKYYTDSTFETEDTSTKFASFMNGYVQPLTLEIIKKSDSGKRLSGAQFSLVRAKHEAQHEEGGETVPEKWIARPNATPKTGTTSQGVLNFDNLTEGHYILEETVPPSGYVKGDPSKWLLTLTKQDSADKILLIPTIMPLNEDGTVPADAQVQTLDVNDNNVFEYEVLNGKIPRGDLVVEKQWLKADGETAYTNSELEELGVDGTTITGELWRRATEDAATPPTVSIYSKLNNESTYTLRWQEQVEPGTDVEFSMAVNDTGYPINKTYTTDTGDTVVEVRDEPITYEYDYISGNKITKDKGHVFSLQNITYDVSIYGEFDNTKARDSNNPRIGLKIFPTTAPSGSGQPQTIDEQVGTFILDKNNNWKKTWTSDQLDEHDYDYEYYLKNVSEPSLEGFTFIKDPEVTTDTSTGKVTYSVMNIKEGPKTDLTVRKKWGDNLDHSGDSITYKIQRQEYDGSGGPAGLPYDYIAAGEQTAATYTLSSSDSYNGVSWQKHHTDLPATNGKDETDPEYRVYKYTAVETNAPDYYEADPPYVITDTFDDEPYEVTVIRNKPTDARVTVTKKWMDYTGNDEISEDIPEGVYITGTLQRSYTWQEATGRTVRVYYRAWQNGQAGNPTLMYTYNDVQDGTPFYLWAIDANGNEPKNGVQVNGTRMPQTGPGKTYEVSSNNFITTQAFVTNINGDTDIVLDWDYDTGYQRHVFYDAEYTTATSGGASNDETETVGDFRLDATNDWQWVWTDRELDQNHVYTYSITDVKEHKADGTVVDHYDDFLEPVIGELSQGSDGKWTATIINTKEPRTTSLKVTKQWGESGHDSDKITFTLKQRMYTETDGNKHYIGDPVNYSGTYPNEITGNSSVTISDLPVEGIYEEQKVLYEYYVVEAPIANFDTSYIFNEAEDDNDQDEWLIINTPESDVTETTEINVSKEWNGPSGADHSSDNITYKVTQTAIPANYVPLTIVQLRSDGTEYARRKFYAEKNKEFGVHLYTKPSGQTHTFELLKYRIDGNEEVEIESTNKSFTATWAIERIPANQVTQPLVVKFRMKADQEWADHSAAKKWAIGFADNSAYSSLKDLVEDTAAAAGSGTTDVSNSFELTSTGTTRNSEPGVATFGTIDESVSDWHSRIDHLPLYEFIGQGTEGQGYIYTYKVEEIQVNGEPVIGNQTDIYNVTYSVNGSTTDITNTAKNDLIKVDVEKAWLDPDGNKIDSEAEPNATISFRLIQTAKYTPVEGSPAKDDTEKDYITAGADSHGYYTLTKGSDGKWSIEFKNLPTSGKLKEGGNYYDVSYSYKVLEISINNADGTTVNPETAYDVSYTITGDTYEDEGTLLVGNGKITINNKSIATYELPHSGGIGTTLFYIIGSILVLGAGIMLVSRRRISGH